MLMPWIISRRQKVYIPAIPDEAMERTKAPPKKQTLTPSRRDHEDHASCGRSGAQSWYQCGLLLTAAIGPIANTRFHRASPRDCLRPPVRMRRRSRRRGMARRSLYNLRDHLEPRHVAVRAQPEPGQRKRLNADAQSTHERAEHLLPAFLV